jgi:hypothetical protein
MVVGETTVHCTPLECEHTVGSDAEYMQVAFEMQEFSKKPRKGILNFDIYSIHGTSSSSEEHRLASCNRL